MQGATHLALSLARRPGWARPPRCSGSVSDQHGIHDYALLSAPSPPWIYRPPSQRMCRRIPKVKPAHREETVFSFTPMSARFTHRCISVTTIAAIELPIAAAICLVGLRAKSVVRRNSVTASVGSPWPWSRSCSKSTWYACNTDIVQSSTSLTHCHVCPTIQARCIF